MIKGTVTDSTPTGRRNTNDIVDWTLEGTPAISDEEYGQMDGIHVPTADISS